jgi:Putative Flp pilus-assembly TadE/G-like
MCKGKGFSFLRAFLADTHGVTWLYISVASAALFGFAALVIDFTRVEVTHTQARAAAEAAALAGASQLDGNLDSITRATNAAQTTPLVQNTQTLGTSPGNITITGIRFLSGIPAGDPTLPRSPSALDSFVLSLADPDAPLEARFIEVTTQQVTVNNSFIQILGGGGTAVTISEAVAGFTQVLCRRSPLAICNPVENPASPYGTPAPPFNIADWKGRQILIKGAGPGADWVPGDFALVDVDGLQSTPAIWEALAESEPDVCINARIDLKPGQVQGARNALNTRFGMYENPHGGNKGGNSRFRPARSVAKGMVLSDPTDQCSFVDATSVGLQDRSMALPRDVDATNYAGATNGTGPTNSHRFGTGSWNCAAYMAAMHPTVTPLAWCTSTTDGTVAGRSRYDAYRAEIDGTAPFTSQTIPNRSGDTPPGENANSALGACYTGGAGTLSDTPDRRLLYFAVINCIELGPLRGNSNGDLPVEAFVESFLTETVADPSDGPEILLEVKDIVRPGVGGVLHDIVQLYR